MKPSKNSKHLLFGGTFLLANKLQFVADSYVEGISTKQWFLLRNILDLPTEPPPTITQIAECIDSTRQNITKMLIAMEREGIVALEDSTTDHRSRSVLITELGYKYAEQTAQNAQDFLERLYDDISQNELDIAGDVLKKMVKNLEIMQEGLK